MKWISESGNGQTIYYPHCERCETRLEMIVSQSQKYCAECKEIVNREKSKERMRKYREKKKQQKEF